MPVQLENNNFAGPGAGSCKIEIGCEPGRILQAGTDCELVLSYQPSQLPHVQAGLQLRSDQGNPPALRLDGLPVQAEAPPDLPPPVPVADGGGCSVGPPERRSVDPVLALALLVSAWALGGRVRRQRIGDRHRIMSSN